jgi:hypothetical protein
MRLDRGGAVTTNTKNGDCDSQGVPEHGEIPNIRQLMRAGGSVLAGLNHLEAYTR